MSFGRQSLRSKSPFGEFDDPPVPGHEASSKKHRRRLSTLSSNNSYQIDKLLQDENNDWFFEKILEKFEDIRSKKSNQYARSSSNEFNNDPVYGVERIIERRYYVKKPKLVSKRSQLTSTSDLKGHGKKNRQLSGVSSVTAATTCSQCSSTSSTPTFVENLRDQSDTLRNDISELKHEIEQLQTSQQEFFQQLRAQFQSKTNFAPPAISPLRSTLEKARTVGNIPIPLTTGRKSRSISTESLASSSSATSSGQTTPTRGTAVKPIAAPTRITVRTKPAISEFMATKNPSIAPTPPITAYVSSKPSSVAPKAPATTYTSSKPPSLPSTPLVNAYASSKSSSIAPTPPAAAYVDSKSPSLAPTPPVNAYISTKPSSVAPTPPTTRFATSNNSANISATPIVVPIGPLGSKPLSVAPTPLVASSPTASARMPIYENELAHRRVLSPRSQIVASSASIQDSSDSSSGTVSPDFIGSSPQKIPKVPVTTLRDNDLQDLVRYSSQLGLSGFPVPETPVITNPNNSSYFWESVDQYIENSRSTNIPTGLPPILRSNNGNRFGFNNSTTRQLDKYDLEIKPQEFIESSAPFLMPPLDILT